MRFGALVQARLNKTSMEKRERILCTSEKGGKDLRFVYLSGFGKLIDGEFAFQSILMNNPIRFLSFRRSPLVENQSFLHPNQLLPPQNLSIFAGSFPVARCSSSVRPHPSRVLLISHAEKVPFLFPQFRPPFQSNRKNLKITIDSPPNFFLKK